MLHGMPLYCHQYLGVHQRGPVQPGQGIFPGAPGVHPGPGVQRAAHASFRGQPGSAGDGVQGGGIGPGDRLELFFKEEMDIFRLKKEKE